MKRYCSVCHTGFIPQGSEWQCPSCLKWNEYKCNHPIVERKPQADEIHFAFYPSESYNMLHDDCKKQVLGVTEHNKRNEHSVTIYLFNFDGEKQITDITRSISHEYLHLAISLSSDWMTSKKADDGLLKKLENQGYL